MYSLTGCGGPEGNSSYLQPHSIFFFRLINVYEWITAGVWGQRTTPTVMILLIRSSRRLQPQDLCTCGAFAQARRIFAQLVPSRSKVRYSVSYTDRPPLMPIYSSLLPSPVLILASQFLSILESVLLRPFSRRAVSLSMGFISAIWFSMATLKESSPSAVPWILQLASLYTIFLQVAVQISRGKLRITSALVP